jgi:hypothetical protein
MSLRLGPDGICKICIKRASKGLPGVPVEHGLVDCDFMKVKEV